MHLCIAGSIRAMPEKEKQPAMPVDIYFLISVVLKKNSRRNFTAAKILTGFQQFYQPFRMSHSLVLNRFQFSPEGWLA